MSRRNLPAQFLAELDALASSYLAESDPYLQSGFGGGAVRFREEREPVLGAIEPPGTELLDVGCANGLLLECLVAWAAERGRRITPYGIDQSAGLVELARRRLPRFSGNFFVANAWSWRPPRRFAHVYALCDCVPADYLEEFVHHLFDHYVRPGGRLIVGSYGSRSRGTPPLDVAARLAELGFPPAGEARGGRDGVARFAWADDPSACAA